jgi:hypothetical protein
VAVTAPTTENQKELAEMIHVSDQKTAVTRAMQAVERAYGCQPGERAWVSGGVAAAYGKETTMLFALEGSPPKGYVLLLLDAQIVTALGVHSKVIKQWFFQQRTEEVTNA